MDEDLDNFEEAAKRDPRSASVLLRNAVNNINIVLVRDNVLLGVDTVTQIHAAGQLLALAIESCENNPLLP